MSRDYPRWMFHPRLDAVMVESEEQEARLGPGWTRSLAEALAAAAPKLSNMESEDVHADSGSDVDEDAESGGEAEAPPEPHHRASPVKPPVKKRKK